MRVAMTSSPKGPDDEHMMARPITNSRTRMRGAMPIGPSNRSRHRAGKRSVSSVCPAKPATSARPDQLIIARSANWLGSEETLGVSVARCDTRESWDRAAASNPLPSSTHTLDRRGGAGDADMHGRELPECRQVGDRQQVGVVRVDGDAEHVPPDVGRAAPVPTATRAPSQEGETVSHNGPGVRRHLLCLGEQPQNAHCSGRIDLAHDAEQVHEGACADRHGHVRQRLPKPLTQMDRREALVQRARVLPRRCDRQGAQPLHQRETVAVRDRIPPFVDGLQERAHASRIRRSCRPATAPRPTLLSVVKKAFGRPTERGVCVRTCGNERMKLRRHGPRKAGNVDAAGFAGGRRREDAWRVQLRRPDQAWRRRHAQLL